MEEDKRNMLLFFAISMLIMIGYPYFFNSDTSQLPSSSASQIASTSTEVVKSSANNVKREAVRSAPVEIKNIEVDSTNLSGYISTQGAIIDHIFLKKYTKSSDDSSPVSVFGNEDSKADQLSIKKWNKDGSTVKNVPSNYYAMSTWAADNESISVPDENTCWSTKSSMLSEKTPLVLTWDNGEGLIFEKRISVDEKYLITIKDSVKNYSSSNITLRSINKIIRIIPEGKSDSLSFYEGPLAYVDGKLKEISYEDISKKLKNGEDQQISGKTLPLADNGGWFGITDKYWLVAFIPDKSMQSRVDYKQVLDPLLKNNNAYIIESAGDVCNIPAGESVTVTSHLFTGAKEVNTLDIYEDKIGVKHFDLAIDFGWLYILTKPLLYALAYTKDLVGNMGLGIILITLLIKLLLFPLANKSYRSMNRMKAIQPKIQALQKRYADDKVKLGQAISELYKKEQINPVGGCLPLLLQSPVLFALYKVLYISIEMRQASFFGWIHDLSLPDPLNIFNLFGLLPISLPSFLQIGIWPLIMGVSMFLQQKMSPAPADPSQEKVMLFMPIIFTFMFAQLPSGLIIYWTFSNLLGIAQQYMIIKIDNDSKKRKKN